MTCPSCGREGPPRDGHCVHCGAALDESSLGAGRDGAAATHDEDRTIAPSAAELECDATVAPGQASAAPDEPAPPPDIDPDHTVTPEEARRAAVGPGEDLDDDHTVGVGEVLAGGHTAAPPKDLESDGTVVLEEGSAAAPRAPSRAEAPRQGGPLRVGDSFGDRYRIDVLLGIGGMGAVYKAWDRELDIPVALKVIRPEIAGDEKTSAEISRRFKRELLLARKVTHKNVVRIHDLGDIDGIKYITMSFIEGDTLAWLLKAEGSLPVPRALRIWRYIVSGMLEAHKAGVVHRDLKPANVMIDNETGEPHLMDFGIARSDTSAEEETEAGPRRGAPVSRLVSGDETKAGEIIGTVQYMPPEQFYGKKVDQRADIYAMGLIFYDMLLGPRRAQSAKSALGELQGRLKASPPSPITVDPSIPEPLDRIIAKCLEPDPDERYQTTAELAAELDRLDDEGNPLPVTRLLTRRMVVAAIGAVVLLLAGTWFMASRRAPPTEQEPISVLIADFDNQTGDASFDGAVEQALTIAMEGAAFITAYSRPNAQRIAEQLQPGSRLDETTARLVSRREGVSVILAGTIASEGDGYALSVRALDPGVEPGEGKPMATARARAPDKEDVLTAVAEIAADLRGDLGDTTPTSDQLAAAETFTAASLDAMRSYARGQDLVGQGKFEEAIGAYQEAVVEDPDFGRAYAGMGVVYGNLRREAEAEDSYQQAFQHLDRMSERERYRTLGGYYLLVSHNYDKAIENYQKLVELFPADGVGYSNLGYSYHMARDFDSAMRAASRSVELDPGNLIKRINYAIYAMNAGEFETAIAESQIVIEQNPDFGYALFTMGRSAAAAGDISAARDAFERLAASGGMGSSLAPMGQGDLELYLGQNRDAIGILEPAVDSSESPFETATMLVAVAQARLVLGQKDQAAAAAERALELSRHESVMYLAARVLLGAGRDDAANELSVELENKLQSQTTAFSALIRGERALRDGQLGTAMREFRWAREEYDFWFVHYLSGLTYMQAEQFPEAFDEFDLCVRRNGEIIDVFLVDSATLRFFPPALYWLGRTQEALGSPDAAHDLYRQFLDLRGDADPPDPLAADARERLGEG